MAERVTFASSTGPRLAGLVDLPDSAIRGWGVFSHGFTLGKDSPAASRICKQLASDGIGMLRFDALGLGDSEGDWGDGSFTVKVLGLPLLILHSPTDNTVGIENASEIFGLARHPRSFVSLEGSDHLLTVRGQAHRAGRIIGAWADAYLDEPLGCK
jgi:hypothetical protein